MVFLYFKLKFKFSRLLGSAHSLACRVSRDDTEQCHMHMIPAMRHASCMHASNCPSKQSACSCPSMLSPDTHFTPVEILGCIKGSAAALTSPRGHLSKVEYLSLASSRASGLDEQQRADVYHLFRR